MKRTKFFAGAVALIFAMSLGFVSCSDSDDGGSNVMADENLETVAYNVLRSLCVLDGDSDGIEELPANWQSADYEIDEGYILDEKNPTVRYVPAYSSDDAYELFADIVGEYEQSESCAWYYEGIGKITLKVTSDETDGAFAVMDFDVELLPNLSQLRFVPAEVIEASEAENSFSGIPYYSAGDIIQRTSDDTYWICVRPAGGPLRKDKSYWICLNPLNTSGKNTLVKTTTENVSYTATYTYKAADGSYKNAIEKKSEKWTFAKNLMSLKTAKAAHHTFNLIANPWTWANKSNQKGEELYKSLCNAKFDLRNLMNYKNLAARNGGDEIMDDDEENGQALAEEEADYDSYIPNGSFCFAYGSVTKDSKRITSGSRKNAGTKYIQPFLFCTSKMESEQAAYYCISEQIFTMDEFGDSYSATNSFDGDFVSAQDTLSWQEGPYNIENFLHTVYADGVLGFSNESAAYNKKDSLYAYHIFFSPELCIKDNKGKTAAERPVGIAYKDIYRSGMPEWWWASLETSVRHVDGVAVNWNKENE